MNGWDAIELRGGELRALVLPGRGGDVLDLRHTPSDSALLWRAPWTPPAGPRVPRDADFVAWYQGGWQDLLPNGGGACVVDGVVHGWHGESWRRAWTVLAREPAAVELELALETLPLRVRKRIELDGATLRLRERIEHVGDVAAQLMWGHHPAFGGDLLQDGCRLDLPGGRTECLGAQIDETSVLAAEGEGRWPFLPDPDGVPVDLSAVPGPDHRSHDLCMVTDLAAGWYALRNPRRGLGVALRFPRELFRWLWIWRPLGGVTAPPLDGGTYALAVEPWTSPLPSLEGAIARGAALRLQPGETLDAELELTVFAAGPEPWEGCRPQPAPRPSII